MACTQHNFEWLFGCLLEPPHCNRVACRGALCNDVWDVPVAGTQGIDCLCTGWLIKPTNAPCPKQLRMGPRCSLSRPSHVPQSGAHHENWRPRGAAWAHPTPSGMPVREHT